MRKVITLSLPAHLDKVVEAVVATGQYHTKSEFFRTLLRDWMDQRLRQDAETRKSLPSNKLRNLVGQVIAGENTHLTR